MSILTRDATTHWVLRSQTVRREQSLNLFVSHHLTNDSHQIRVLHISSAFSPAYMTMPRHDIRLGVASNTTPLSHTEASNLLHPQSAGLNACGGLGVAGIVVGFAVSMWLMAAMPKTLELVNLNQAAVVRTPSQTSYHPVRFASPEERKGAAMGPLSSTTSAAVPSGAQRPHRMAASHRHVPPVGVWSLGGAMVALAAAALVAMRRRVACGRPREGPGYVAMMSTTGTPDDAPVSRRNLLTAAGAAAVVANKIAVEGPAVFTPAAGSLEGRTILITGGNHGLGKESAIRLAKGGAQVVFTARTAAKGEAALADIKAASGSDAVSFLVLDLADLRSVRACAAAFLQRHARLDVLLNNAGVMAIPEFTATADGFETQFGVNHLGHFALTALLQGALLRAAEGGRHSRVINVSSAASNLGQRFDFAAVTDPARYSQWPAYFQSKLANVCFTKELDRRYKAAGAPVTAVTLHPGVVRTELARYAVFGRDELMGTAAPSLAAVPLLPVGLYFTKGVDRGANTQIWLAAGADGGGDYAESGGLYFQNLKPLPPNPLADDAALREALWTESERLTQIPFVV